jgi:hypothetical protein
MLTALFAIPCCRIAEKQKQGKQATEQEKKRHTRRMRNSEGIGCSD